MTNDEKLAEAHMTLVDEATRAVMDATISAHGGPAEIMLVLESTCLQVAGAVGLQPSAFVEALCERLRCRSEDLGTVAWRVRGKA